MLSVKEHVVLRVKLYYMRAVGKTYETFCINSLHLVKQYQSLNTKSTVDLMEIISADFSRTHTFTRCDDM